MGVRLAGRGALVVWLLLKGTTAALPPADSIDNQLADMAQHLQTLKTQVLTQPATTFTQARALRQHMTPLRQKLLKASLPEQKRTQYLYQLQSYEHQMVKLMRASRLLQDIQLLDKTPFSAESLPLLETWERALQELADEWQPSRDERRQLREQDQKEIPTNSASPVTPSEMISQEKKASTNPYQEMAAAYRARISDLQKHHTPGQQPLFRTYRPPVMTSASWPADLQQSFRQFDHNQDGRLTLGEGEAFFYWVARHFTYRYDDEKLTGVRPGFPIGDGRPGPDYRQSAQETLREKMGDCEDLATLQATFYQSFGIKAYVVCVNAQNKQLLDHAIAIVKIGDTPAQYRQALGGLLYYQIHPGQRDVKGQAVSPGYYMAVDNAYSSTFGYISGGIQPGAFRLKCVFPANDVFGGAWERALKMACGGFIAD